MPTLKSALAKNIKYYRDLRGFSQTELANKISSTQRSISNYETEAGGISLETIAKLADVLDVEETDLTYPGTPPEPIVKTPTPLEALKIVEDALKDSEEKLADPLISGLVSILPSLNEDERKLIEDDLGVIASRHVPGASHPRNATKKKRKS